MPSTLRSVVFLASVLMLASLQTPLAFSVDLNPNHKNSVTRKGLRAIDPGHAVSGLGPYTEEHQNKMTWKDTPLGAKYSELGREKGFLGKPLDGLPNGGERTTPDMAGQYVRFQNGSIYWSKKSGAHEVHGLIRDKWASLGFEKGFLGYPLSDETITPDKEGRFNLFQGGAIYWSQKSGAHEVHGLIREKWDSLNGIGSPLHIKLTRVHLGYPISDETVLPDKVGRCNLFQNGSIYWSPSTGAHVVQNGAIISKWFTMGSARGKLGYPIADEGTSPDGKGRTSEFQHGFIDTHPNAVPTVRLKGEAKQAGNAAAKDTKAIKAVSETLKILRHSNN
jgi:uncharacterized protein with LGFP repeats